MKNFFIMLLIFLIINFINVYSHSDWPKTVSLTLGANTLFNTNSVGISPDLNYTFVIFNSSFDVEFFNKLSPSYKLYLGMGYVNLLQIQFGTNFSDKFYRFRTVLPIFTEKFGQWTNQNTDKFKWYEKISLQVHFENSLTNSMLYTFGFGLSYLIL